MRILKIAVGNEKEAYIERALQAGINIISSDDNNKGKTIVVQAMMYALGNEPAFPVSFDFRDYSYYVEFEVNEIVYALCRKGDTFVLKYNTTLMLFDNVSELKRYWTKHIFKLPVITKNQISKIVDPMLFLQLFFVGQDKKDTSNIANSGFYNKQDYMEMLYALAGIGSDNLSQEETESLKTQIANLKEEKKVLLKQHKILKSKKTPVSYLSSTSDKIAFEAKLKEMEKHRSKIEELRKSRNASITRRMKWETTLKELRSLNRTINGGELKCMDCNSTNISFTTNQGKQQSYAFDVSTVALRNDIIDSIQEKIASYNEEIERISIEISKEQEKLQETLDEESITIESIVMYKQEVFSASDAEKQIHDIESHISKLESQLTMSENATEKTRKRRNELFELIVNKMIELYRLIDPNGNAEYKHLFTTRNTLYSGSEATVFHLTKLLAIQYALKHDYPIIIDSFRAEDLSTQKEQKIIELFKGLGNQAILTTTLKDEEAGKYDQLKGVNHIDYRSHQPSKILQVSYVEEMKHLLSVMSLDL